MATTSRTRNHRPACTFGLYSLYFLVVDAPSIATYLAEAKVGLLAHYSSFVALGYPEVLEGLYQSLSGTPGGKIPLVVKRRDGTIHPTPDVGEILRQARALKGFGFGPDLFTFIMRAISVKLGDEVAKAGLIQPNVPLLQFVRHLRNASAHNNRWKFRAGEPRYPSQFRGFMLDASMHGQAVFLDYLSVGDFLDLLDDVAAHLRSLPRAKA